MNNETHWMVFCPEMGPSTVKHTFISEAKNEAKRICQKENKEVFVFECSCIGRFEPPEQPTPKWITREEIANASVR